MKMKNLIFGFLALQTSNIIDQKEKQKVALSKVEEIGTIPLIIEEIKKPYKITSEKNLLFNSNEEEFDQKNNNKLSNIKVLRKILFYENSKVIKNLTKENYRSSKLLDNLKSTLLEKKADKKEKNIDVMIFYLFYNFLL